MAKSNFSAREKEIWNSIYGTSRGPTPGRLKILVEDFAAKGLVPVMMRIGDEMLPYEGRRFRDALHEAFSNKDDDQVQAYYHPVDCEQVVGSTATTWTQWGRLIFETEGLIPKNAGDDHPVVVENLPRLRLPTEVREALLAHNVSTSSVCRLLSLRLVVFFIAAQYEAWSTAAEVGQVTPFKEVIRKQGFSVRDVIVRKDEGLDDVLRDLDPAVRQPHNAPASAPAEDIAPSTSVEGRVAQAVEVSDALRAILAAPVDEVVPEEDAIEAEIEATEARLAALRRRREEARLAAKKRDHLAARVTDVVFHWSGRAQSLEVTLPSGEVLTCTVERKDPPVDDLLMDIL